MTENLTRRILDSHPELPDGINIAAFDTSAGGWSAHQLIKILQFIYMLDEESGGWYPRKYVHRQAS